MVATTQIDFAFAAKVERIAIFHGGKRKLARSMGFGELVDHRSDSDSHWRAYRFTAVEVNTVERIWSERRRERLARQREEQHRPPPPEPVPLDAMRKAQAYADVLVSEWGPDNADWCKQRAMAAYGLCAAPAWSPKEPSSEWKATAIYQHAMARLCANSISLRDCAMRRGA